MTGVIKSIHDKGFGFIKPDDGSDDLFFHAKDLADDTEFGEALRERRVEFDRIVAERGPRAREVKIL